MELAKYLNLPLKSTVMIELFEDHGVDVHYVYDRLHEGIEDRYIGAIPSLGLQFVFDDKQILKTIFVYVRRNAQFHPATLSDHGINAFDDLAAVMGYSEQQDIECTLGQSDFLGENRAWAKLMLNNYSVHYEFRADVLWLVTLQVNDGE